MGKTKPTIEKSLGSPYFLKATAEMLLKGMEKDRGCWVFPEFEGNTWNQKGQELHSLALPPHSLPSDSQNLAYNYSWN